MRDVERRSQPKRKTDGVDNKTGSGDLPVGLFVEWRVKLFFGFSEKYFCFHTPQINSRTLAVPAHRGAFRDRHKRWAWDAVDAAAPGAQRGCRAGHANGL
jgi:hypothetical protein